VRPLPPQLRRLAAICLPLTILASPLHSQSLSLPPGRSPDELRRLAQQMGYSPEQLRATGQSPEALDALLKNAPPAAAPFDSSALAPRVPKPEVRSSAAAPPPPDDGQPFGYEVFRYSPTTFEPLAYGPVDSDYPIGPGDELVVTLWGDAQLALTTVVNREGALVLPDVGTIPVSGLTLDGARSRIRAVLARNYAGLRSMGRSATVSLDVSLGKLRSIQVFLLGEIVKPGGYTVSSVSRVLNALYVAGGATRQGSLRDVRVVRGGQVIATLDLYRLLLTGDAADETRLENGDVVFVPPAGRRVKVSGPLRRTGVFELTSGENLRALLHMTGGPLADADLERAQINRVVPPALRDSLRGQDRIALDISLADSSGGGGPDVPLCDADELVAFSIGQERHNTVQIGGTSVLKPGVFQFRPGMHVRDLVALAGGLKPEAFLGRAQVTRTAADRTRSVLRVDLERALAGDPADDAALEPLDELSVLSKWDVEERGQVSIDGLVRHPGRYEYLEGMTLADLVFQAGGLTDDALILYAELARVDLRAQGSHIADTLRVPLERTMSANSRASVFPLTRWDAVFVRRDPAYHEQLFVSVDGEVRFPGRYALTRRDERIADLVRRAGGLTEFAYAAGASFSRSGAPRLGIDLPAVLRDARSPSNLVLESSDLLTVPRFRPVVTIEGAVFNPVTALYRPGSGVGYYVTQANGYRQDADKHRTVVIQENGSVQKGGTPGPGSRVVVPARPPTEQKDHLKDLATLLGMLASAATTVYLVHQGVR
jgi:polysaccharide biosynthesis/export protein